MSNDEAKVNEVLNTLDRSLVPLDARFDDIYTIDDFMHCCVDGTFTDYDGIGCYATATGYSVNYRAIPSLIVKGILDCKWTHVVWFNR